MTGQSSGRDERLLTRGHREHRLNVRLPIGGLAGAVLTQTPELAHAIASKCVLGVCVGHEAELTAVCEGGLDAVVDLAHDELAKLRLEALRLVAGTATVVATTAMASPTGSSTAPGRPS